jgi:hypothetical protein
MVEVIFEKQFTLSKRKHPQKWGSPFINYCVTLTLNVTLFLVEGGSSFGTTRFFFLTMTDLFGGVVLSLTVDVSFSMAASANTCKFL